VPLGLSESKNFLNVFAGVAGTPSIGYPGLLVEFGTTSRAYCVLGFATLAQWAAIMMRFAGINAALLSSFGGAALAAPCPPGERRG